MTVLGYASTVPGRASTSCSCSPRAVRRGLRTPFWSATCRSAPTRSPTSRPSPPRSASSRRRAATPSSSRAAARRRSQRARAIVEGRHPGDGPRRPDAADLDRAGRLQGPGPHAPSARRAVARRGARAPGGRLLLDRLRGDPGRRDRRAHAAMEIPVIGIGAGPATDGQVLVFHDLLGIREGLGARFVKRYADLQDEMVAGVAAYADDVRTRASPAPEHGYSIDPRSSSASARAADASRRRDAAARHRHAARPQAVDGVVHATLARGRWPGCRQVFAPATASSSTSSRRPAANIVRAADLLDQMLAALARPRGAGARHPHLRAGGRPDHARHHPAPQPDVRHADRPRGHPRAGLGARRHRRLHRGGRGLPRPLQDRGADGAGPAAGPHPAPVRRARSPRRCRGCAASRTLATTRSRSTGWRTTATASCREAIASLFDDGIDPMVVIRWKDIFERLEQAIDARETGREHARGHRHQERLGRAAWTATSSSSSSSRRRWPSTSPTASTTPPTPSRRRSRRARCRRGSRWRIAAILNFVGAFISLKVAATVANGIVDSDAITPTDRLRRADRRDRLEPRRPGTSACRRSSSHALIGGVVGAAFAAAGPRRDPSATGCSRRSSSRPDRADAGLRRRPASRSSSPTGSSAASGPGPVNRGYRLGQLVSGACSRWRTAPTTPRRRWASSRSRWSPTATSPADDSTCRLGGRARRRRRSRWAPTSAAGGSSARWAAGSSRWTRRRASPRRARARP